MKAFVLHDTMIHHPGGVSTRMRFSESGGGGGGGGGGAPPNFIRLKRRPDHGRLKIVVMPSPSYVFEAGKYTVQLVHVESGTTKACGQVVNSAPHPPPLKPLLIATPTEEGEFPTLILLHGYLLYNSFYSQLIQHIASHGFIVVAPQLYYATGPDSTEEIKSAATITDWLINGLLNVLPVGVHPNLSKLGLAGHSRGGKVAFALALGHASTALRFSALIGIDPVDGMDKGKQTVPPILTYNPRSLDLKMGSLVIGTGLGELKRNALFPPCAPKGVGHQDFYDECRSPTCHFVVKEYGHLDMLDDETKGIRGKVTYCLCRNGESRKPMRLFVGGIMVAFLKAYLEGDSDDLFAIRHNPEFANVVLSTVHFSE